MTTRQVLPTDPGLVNGQDFPRAYISQQDSEFAQKIANALGVLDNIIYNNDTPSTSKIIAIKELRFLCDTQMKLLAEIERRQDAQEMQNKSKNLRQMVSSDPAAALKFIDNEIKKLNEFRGWVLNLIGSPLTIDAVSKVFKALPDGSDPF